MDRFSAHVCGKLGSYVYRLIDPRTGRTFYVGKGVDNRVFDHIRQKIDEMSNDGLMPLKLATIKDILQSGLAVQHVIHRYGLTPKEAFEVEAALIEAYDDLTNLQSGHHSFDRGSRTADEIERDFAVDELEVAHKVLFVNLARSRARRNATRTNDLDAARFAWPLSRRRVEQCEYVLAHRDGVVRGIFQPTKWLDATPANFPTLTDVEIRSRGRLRLGFQGAEVADPIVLARYLNKRVPLKIAKAHRQPVQYGVPV